MRVVATRNIYLFIIYHSIPFHSIPFYFIALHMNTIKTSLEDLIIGIITYIRDTVKPIFAKYSDYYKYVDVFFYGTYAVILLGFYNTVPEYIPVLRNTILYIAVFVLLLRFNTISWTNSKFAILGGNKFSDFDRRLIISTCIFILITHIVSETVSNYIKKQVQKNITQPVTSNVVHPVYNYIDTSGVVDNLPAVKKFIQEQTVKQMVEKQNGGAGLAVQGMVRGRW